MSTKINSAVEGSNMEHESESQFPLVKINFILMGVAALMIILGFVLMSGGAPESATEFNPEVFSTRRIVVGPAITFIGFIFMGFGIMWPGKK